MSTYQTIIGLERAFAGRTTVATNLLDQDATLDEDKAPWFLHRTQFPVNEIRVHTRPESERRIAIEGLETILQTAIEAESGSDSRIEFTRDVAIGALYTDDLPVGNPDYANVYIVVSLEMSIDIPLPRDAHVLVELYFGWRQQDDSIRVADQWYYRVDVSNVGPVRRRRVIRDVTRLLTNTSSGPSVGEQIRDGLRRVFNVNGISTFYVIPGSGARTATTEEVIVRHDASFFVLDA